MPDDQVARIAGESDETRTEREQLNKQLEVLQNGLETCKRFTGFRISGDSAFVSAKESDNLASIHKSHNSSGHTPGANLDANSDAELELPPVRSISPPPEPAYSSTLGPNMELAPAKVDEEVQEESHATAAEIEVPEDDWSPVSPAKTTKGKKKQRVFSYEA